MPAGTLPNHSLAGRNGRCPPLVVVLAAVSAGVIFDRYQPGAVAAWCGIAAAMWIGWFAARWLHRDRLAVAPLLICLAATAAAWHHAHWHLCRDDDLGLFARNHLQPVCVEVVARGEPCRAAAPRPDPLRQIPRVDQSRLEVAVTAIRDGQSWRTASGRATMLVGGHLLGVHAGDRLRVLGHFARPTPARNPGEFDFALHHRADGRLSTLGCESPDCISVLEPARGWSLGRTLLKLRSSGDELLARQLSPKHAALAAAILLGEQHMTSEQTEAYFTTGTIHLLVVSGLHVGILVGALFLFARLGLVPQRQSLVLMAVLVVLYALLTGTRPPVVRATVLVVALCTGKYLGRRALDFNLLAAAALVVLALNPADLFRTGPQLSFLAVAALMWGGMHWWMWNWSERDPLRQLIWQSRPAPVRAIGNLGGWYWRMTLASAAVWLVALPLVTLRFHLVSPIAVVLSPLLGPLLAVCLLSGFGLLVAGSLIPPLAGPLAVVCDASLHLLEFGVQWGQRVPGSHFWVAGPAEWWVIGFYVIVAAAVVFRLRRPAWPPMAMLAVWVAVGLGLGLGGGRGQRDLHCTFVALDHGCSVIVELPDGRTLLYDAGRIGSPASAAQAIAACLWSRGITHLDAVVLSHADTDHYNAVPELLRRFTAGVIYTSPVMFRDDTPPLASLRSAIATAGVPIEHVWKGMQLPAGGGAAIRVLHPPPSGMDGSDNANSIVLAIEFEAKRILLTGDLESPGLEKLLAAAPYDSDVALAPHHGSRHSDPPGFSNWSTPEWLVISGRHHEDLGQVAQTYSQAGAQVLHTAEVGAVEVHVADGRLDVSTSIGRPRLGAVAGSNFARRGRPAAMIE